MSVIYLIREDLRTYTRDSTASFVDFIRYLLKSPGFQAGLLHRLSHSARSNRLTIFSFLIDRLILLFYGAEIRSTAQIGAGLNIAHTHGIVIGGRVKIGTGFSIRQCTTIGGNMGKTRSNLPHQSQPIIGNNVLIGCNSAILGPIKIGNNVVVGACSLVLKDVQDNRIVAGVPSRELSSKQ